MISTNYIYCMTHEIFSHYGFSTNNPEVEAAAAFEVLKAGKRKTTITMHST